MYIQGDSTRGDVWSRSKRPTRRRSAPDWMLEPPSGEATARQGLSAERRSRDWRSPPDSPARPHVTRPCDAWIAMVSRASFIVCWGCLPCRTSRSRVTPRYLWRRGLV